MFKIKAAYILEVLDSSYRMEKPMAIVERDRPGQILCKKSIVQFRKMFSV
jgi:hypothetical protein